MMEALQSHAFLDYLTPTQKGQRAGFARADQPLVLPADFHDLSTWNLSPYVFFALRIDDKKVPAKRLKARVDERVKEWCRANLRERAPSSVKQEIKEQVELELLPRCMPSSKVISIVWHTGEGWILLSTRTTSQVDAVRKLLHRAFGVSTLVEAPDDGLSADTLERLAQTSPLSLS
jgi:DNA recombination-dependent growth factor C